MKLLIELDSEDTYQVIDAKIKQRVAEVLWARKDTPPFQTVPVKVEKKKWSPASLHALVANIIP